MPMQSFCDNCGSRTIINAAAEPTSIIRERIEIEIRVLNYNGTTDPIICPRCVRLVAQFAEE